MTAVGHAEHAALQSYLADELAVEVDATEVVHDGVNLTIVASVAGEAAYVVQRPTEIRDQATFNPLQQEFGVLERLQETAVPAPDPVLVCEDESIIGGPFLVTTYRAGESVPLGSDLPERFRTPPAREAVATELVDTLATLHTVETAPVAEPCEHRPIDAHLEEIVGQFETALAATGHEPPRFERVRDWLQANLPPGEGAAVPTALVHGDYRPSNVLFAHDDEPEIAAVLDWETAFLGDPRTELGYLLLRWRDDGDPTPALDGIAERGASEGVLDQLRERNETGLAPFTDRLGSPTRRALVERYEARTGIAFEHERFYRAFAAFTLAAVWAQLHRFRVAGGEDADADADADDDWQAHVEYMLALSGLIADGSHTL